MLNYVSVNFPNSTVDAPSTVYEMTITQNMYEHEVFSIKFRDWNVRYDVIKTGSPIQITLKNVSKSETFYGYVHHVNVERNTGYAVTEVVAVGASMVMKNESQAVYKGLSADAIIRKIAANNKFVAFTVPCARIYPQVSQAGHSDWELCVRLAKQNGYSLRAHNTELYFQPLLNEFGTGRQSAPIFVMREANDPSGSNLYRFEPTISESLDYNGDKKAAIAVLGVDNTNKSAVAVTKKNRINNTRTNTVAEFFDHYATDIVAPNAQVAKYESEAAELRTTFAYRATAEVIGNPTLRSDMPIYIKGVNNSYDGYWTILGVEHRIVEKERNIQLFTTILELGTDSLGQSAIWTDGTAVQAPSASKTRVIIPGVKQTVIKPQSTLIKNAPQLSPLSTGQFGNAKNRSKPNTFSLPVNAPQWATKTATLNPTATPSGSVAPKSNPRATKRIPGIV